MAGMHAIIVANLMSEATAPCTGRPVINARVLIIPNPFVIPRYSSQDSAQPLQEQEVTTAAEMCIYWEQQWPWQRRWQTSSEEEDAKETTKAESIRGYIQKLSPIRSDNDIWWREKQQ